MPQQMHAGKLITAIRIQTQMLTGAGINKTVAWVDIGNSLPSDAPVYTLACWEGLYGGEAWIADSVQAQRPAKVTVRYRSDITEKCRVVLDGVNYEVISILDVGQRHAWLEMRVKAAVNG
jgi:SPP1 family predicted phage head-tail adaptor